MNADNQNGVQKAPLLRRLWLVVVETCSLILMPVAMITLLTGNVYRKGEEGWRPISNGERYTYGGLLALWLMAVTAKAVLQPGGIAGELARSAPTETAQPTNTAGAAGPSTASGAPNGEEKSASADASGSPESCTSQITVETLKEAIEEASKVDPIKVEDFGNANETFFDPQAKVHHCVANAVLSTGSTLVTYQLFHGPSGKPMVQFQTGEKAGMQNVWAQGVKEELALSAKLAVDHKGSCEPYMDPIAGKNIVSDTCQNPQTTPDQSQDQTPEH